MPKKINTLSLTLPNIQPIVSVPTLATPLYYPFGKGVEFYNWLRLSSTSIQKTKIIIIYNDKKKKYK